MRIASGSGDIARRSRWEGTTLLELQGLRGDPHGRISALLLRRPSGTRLASARAGNVIGGGDWGEDRLVPDIMRAALAGEEVRVRNPNSIRPWQHVLNPLSGYLVLAQAVWEEPENAEGWNFGPPEEDARPVGWLVAQLSELWPGELRSSIDDGPHPHEARYLKLDSSRARGGLDGVRCWAWRRPWRPRWRGTGSWPRGPTCAP